MKNKVFTSLVVHVCDARGSVATFLRDANRFLSENFEFYEIIVVENASRDGSDEEARRAAQELNGSVLVISLTRRHSLEAAMLAGSDKSIGDYVFEIESPHVDFPLTLLGDLFKTACSGFDVVAAAPIQRAPLMTRLFYGAFNRALQFDAPLTTERACILSRRALNSLLSINDKNRYSKALLGLTGYAKQIIRYRPTHQQYRDPRTFAEKLSLALELFTSFTNIGSKLSIILSLLFILFSICAGAFAVYSYFYVTNLSRGWTSLMGFLSLSFSGLFFILSILNEYVRQILSEVQHRPFYMIKSRNQKPP